MGQLPFTASLRGAVAPDQAQNLLFQGEVASSRRGGAGRRIFDRAFEHFWFHIANAFRIS